MSERALFDRLPADPAAWSATLDRLSPADAASTRERLLREWIEGRLEPHLVGLTTDIEKLAVVRRHLLVALRPPEGWADAWYERHATIDEGVARRWCWIPAWTLLSQDEDLFLMADDLVTPLLEEAGMGCPKTDYARRIVEHHLRDQVFASLAAGWPAVRDRLRAMAELVPLARRTAATSLAAYLERLASYERPGKVDRTGAQARLEDVWRCAPPEALRFRIEGRTWLADHGRDGVLSVDAKTGAMSFTRSRAGADAGASARRRRA